MSCKQCGQCCERITFGRQTKKDFKSMLIKNGWSGCYVEPVHFVSSDLAFIVTQMIEITTKDDHYFMCPFYDESLKMCLIQQIPIRKPRVCAAYPWYDQDKLNINNLNEGCGFEAEVE